MPFDYSPVDYTRKYLQVTEEALENTGTVEEFFFTMWEKFPESTLLALSNEMNANVSKGGRDWNWRAL